MQDSKTTRYGFIDVVKVISIFFVIFYHSFMCDIDISSVRVIAYINYFVQSVFSVCVPLFFMVNGYLLLAKPLDLKKHTIKMAKLVVCAVFWNAVCAVCNAAIKDKTITVRSILVGAINADYMWFLQALFVVYVFMPVIKSIYDADRKTYMWMLLAFSLFTYGNAFLSIAANTLEFFLGINYIKSAYDFFGAFNPVRGIYGHAIAYFMLGGLMPELRSKLSRTQLICAIVAAWVGLFAYGCIMSLSNGKMYDIVFQGYDSVFTLTMVTALFALLQDVNFDSHPITTFVAGETLGIYCIQQPIIALAKRLLPNFLGANLLTNLAGAVLLLAVCAMLVTIIRKIPLLRETVKL